MGTRVTRRRSFLARICAIGVSIVAMQPLTSCSRLPNRVPPPLQPRRLGFLGPADPRTEHGGFWQALRDLRNQDDRGYDVDYERPSGPNSYADQATRLVKRRPDVILTQGEAATAAAMAATHTIPIVFSMVDDPVEKGFVTSVAWPGGNATGLSNVSHDLVQKRVELARELLPTAERLAIIWSPLIAGQARHVDRVVEAADKLGFAVQDIRVAGQSQIRRDLQALDGGYAQAVLVMPAWFFFDERSPVLDAVGRNRLPGVYSYVGWVRAGGLVSFDGSLSERASILARYVDQILHGAKPADLPVQQQSKFDLVLNRRTAFALRLDIPQTVMLQATEVIEDTNDF